MFFLRPSAMTYNNEKRILKETEIVVKIEFSFQFPPKEKKRKPKKYFFLFYLVLTLSKYILKAIKRAFCRSTIVDVVSRHEKKEIDFIPRIVVVDRRKHAKREKYNNNKENICFLSLSRTLFIHSSHNCKIICTKNCMNIQKRETFLRTSHSTQTL